jgi:MraZ protein
LSDTTENTMFIGQHSLPIDDKGRMTLPASFRDLLGTGAVITQGFERNLMVMPRPVFAGLGYRTGSLNLADPTARLLRRMLLGSAFECALDVSGRLPLPEGLRGFAGVKGQVVLVGQGDYFEIWDVDQWRVQQERLQDVEANAERFIALDIAV